MNMKGGKIMFYAIGLFIRVLVILALILLAVWFVLGVAVPVISNAFCSSFPAACGRYVPPVAPPPTPGPVYPTPPSGSPGTPPQPPTGSCTSSQLGAGKNLSVNMTPGSVYHFNVAHDGYPAGVEDNFLVSVSTATTVVLPEGSAWSYSGCAFADVQQRASRDSAGDPWPTSIPSWLAKPGVSQLTVR